MGSCAHACCLSGPWGPHAHGTSTSKNKVRLLPVPGALDRGGLWYRSDAQVRAKLLVMGYIRVGGSGTSLLALEPGDSLIHGLRGGWVLSCGPDRDWEGKQLLLPHPTGGAEAGEGCPLGNSPVPLRTSSCVLLLPDWAGPHLSLQPQAFRGASGLLGKAFQLRGANT